MALSVLLPLYGSFLGVCRQLEWLSFGVGEVVNEVVYW